MERRVLVGRAMTRAAAAHVRTLAEPGTREYGKERTGTRCNAN